MSLFNLSENFKILSDDLKTAMESSMAYYKLDFFSKLMKGSISATYFLMLGIVFLIFLFFLSVAIALVIGEALENTSTGFFIVGGFYLFIFLIILIFGKSFLTKKFLTSFSIAFFNEDSQKEVLNDEFKDLVD